MVNNSGQTLRSIKHDLDRIIHDLRDVSHPFAVMFDETVWHPFCDVFETEGELVIKMEIAGVAKQDLTISVSENKLVIKGMRQDPCAEGEKRIYHKMEINQGYFERIIILPDDFVSRVAGSTYQNGILEIRMAKKAKDVVTIAIE